MISIIIPVLNESLHIEETLTHLEKNLTNKIPTEIIIIDGGSSDDTIDIINNYTSKSILNIMLQSTDKGRAKQMNYGASLAKYNTLYFLHADGKPPVNFDQLIISKINQNKLAGCFRMKFDWNHWWLKLAGWLTKFNHKYCRGGDQSLFIDKQLFYSIGKYNEDYIIYEDNILISELYKRNQFTVIKEPIITSARLYKEIGLWRLQYYYFIIYFKKWLGKNPNELYEFYKRKIQSIRKKSI